MQKLADWVAPRMVPAPVIEGRFSRLEHLNVDHTADLFEANQIDPSIWTYLFYTPFVDRGAYRDWVVATSARTDTHYYAIQNRSSGRFAGVASYLRDVPDMGVIEVGDINFAQPLQKTAAATEAIFLMMRQVFDAGYRRFEWKCNALNLGSRRAAQRFGFSYEGTFRQHMVVKGQSRDTAWFAITDKDWPALREAFVTWLDPLNFDANGHQIVSLGALTAPLPVASDPALET